jgi:short-subunit dehydrogenase
MRLESKEVGMANQGKLAIVTGASSGIGLELAKLAGRDGYDLIVAADTPLVDASSELAGLGVEVRNVEADLSTFEGVDRLLDAVAGRPIDLLFANAGHGLGRAFLDQDPAEWRHVIDTNITGTVYLIQKVAREMVARDQGRILVTGSIAGHIAGAFQAVYNGSKAFIDSFADALHNELKETEVTVTCLKPGATDTEFFERADMMDTKVGTMKKDDPADVAKTGYEAMMKGERSIIHGVHNKLQVAAATLLGGGASAEMHRKQAEPGTAEEEKSDP